MPSLTLWERLRTRQTVRPRSAGVPVFLCVLIFAMTAIVVSRWGRDRWVPVNCQPTHTATVYAVDQGAGTKTPFTITDLSPRRAAATAHDLAEQYAADRVAQWRQGQERRQLLAAKAVENARQVHRECVERLDAFRQDQQKTADSQAKAAPRELPQPTMIDNPRWLDLNGRVAELRQRYEKLLENRTPQNPLVVQAAERLAAAQKQLAAIPKQIAGPDKEPVLLPPTTDDFSTKEAKRKLDELTAAVEKAQIACERAEESQKAAAVNAAPKFAIENGESILNPIEVDYGWRRLLWTALATGLLMAFGVGSVAAGAKIEPPVASVEEVASLLDKPVIGTMPSDEPVLDVTAIRLQSQVRIATIAIGVMLIVACPIVAVWGVMGI